MTVAAFLQDLERRGVSLSARDDELILRAPKGALSEADRQHLRAQKAAILDWLNGSLPTAQAADGSFPLTEIQEAYLVGRAAELELGRVGCHAYREFENATYDLPRLEAAWNLVVQRHEMLRAVMTEDGRQRVLASVPPYRIEQRDLRESPDAEAEAAALRAARSHRVFDPGCWPLFEVTALLLPGRVRLGVGIDLLVVDAAALVQIFREWGELYAGRILPPPPAARFRDHVERLPPPSPPDRAYWEARLDSLPPGPDLPRLPSEGAPRFRRWTHRLPAARWQALKAAAAERGLTSSALVAAVYADILAAWSRRARFSLTLTRFAAPAGMRGVVGDFTSTILLEVDSTPVRFVDRARALQRRLLDDIEHSGMSGVATLRELRRRRPDFEPVAVVFTSTLGHPALDPNAPSPLGWLGETVYAITQTPQVAMDHHVLEEAGGLVASWDVLEAAFPKGVVEAMVAAYATLLDRLVEGHGWDGRVAAVLPAQPRAPLLAGPAPDLLHAAFERRAAEAPERPAVIAPDRVLDYGTLDRAAGHLAACLTTSLGGPEAARDRLVAISLPKDWRQVVAVLGILRAGAAYLPIDPALPVERQRRLMEASGALPLEEAELEAAVAAGMAGPVPERPALNDPSRLAYVIYTSGSTGVPKGVMIEHAAAVTTVAEVNRRWGLGPTDRVLGLSSLSFDLSVWDIFGPLSVGGALVLPAAEAERDPAHWAGLLDDQRVTVWNSVPALMTMLVEHGLPQAHALRLVLLSGDWVPLHLVRRLRAAAPAARLVALGGATEAAIWSNAHEIDVLDPAWPSIPYGTPLAGQRLHVVNERGDDCPDWVTGEIEIAGAGLARGYLGDPERTAERFVRNALTGERRYRTGDLGRFRPYGDDAAGVVPIEFLGREDAQVKVQGHRIELGEIEAVLAAHPDLADAAVTALPAGSTGAALHAFVVPQGKVWERSRFLLERHGLRRLPDLPRIELPNRPEVELYEARRSVRRFAPGPVPLTALSALLRAVGVHVPELDVQLLAVRVDRLEAGAWRYDPPAHGLVPVPDVPAAYKVADPATARVAAAAAFLLLLRAKSNVSRRAGLLRAGAAGQRLMEAAPAAGLGLCPVGVLEAGSAPVLHSFAGGAPASSVAGFDLAGLVREHCGAVLPAWMVPRHIHLVERLPLSANGKVDRAALRPPELGRGDAAGETQGDLLAGVGALVEEVMGHAVHPQQNLFDCGATSLHLVRLQRLLGERLGSRLAVVDMFRLPSVAALAGAIAGASRDDAVGSGLTRAAKRQQLGRRRP